MRRPSQHSIDLYNQLVTKQNQVRKALLRIHKQQEESFGAGRLPSLIIPKKAHKVRRHDFVPNPKHSSKADFKRVMSFWKRLKEMRNLFGGRQGGLNTYLGKTLKEGYMELWREQIGIEPLGVFHMYTKAQMETFDAKLADFMKTYNRLMRLDAQTFLAMLYNKDIISFKYIYQELNGVYNKEGSWLEQQNVLLDLRTKGEARLKLLRDAENLTGIKHTKATMKKAILRELEEE